MSDICPHFTTIAISSAGDNNTRLLTRLRCKQWSCPVCSKINAMRWRAHLLDGCNKLNYAGARWSFVTLTAPRYAREPHESYKRVNEAFRQLSQLWRRYHRDFGMVVPEYARLLEAHKSGAIHLHAIVRHSLPLRNFVNINHKKDYSKNKKNIFDKPSFRARKTYRIKDLAVMYGAGQQADCQVISNANAGLVVAYITKYMTKSVQGALDLPRGARRIATSRGFGKFGDMENESDLTWSLHSHLHVNHFASMIDKGEDIYDLQQRRSVTSDDFLQVDTYPDIT